MRQLRKLEQLRGYRLRARDGEIGTLEEIYFDDRRWRVRYFVVHTGGWLHGRRVLIVPAVVEGVDETEQWVQVDLTRQQIEDSPPVDTALPVSRHYEREYYRHYGWKPYWISDLLFGPDPSAPPDAASPPEHPHLRDSAEVQGYQLHARDGEIGRIEDFILEDPGWAVRYLQIDIRGWLPGRRVLVSPPWIWRVDWSKREVAVDLTREVIRNAPPCPVAEVIGRDYELALYKHYGVNFDTE